MKVFPEDPAGPLSPELAQTLAYFRAQRAFNAKVWIRAKALMLNDYMRRSGLTACVVAVSGGVDSALVLALAHYASKQNHSRIKRIVPVCLPIYTSGAATGQDSATVRGVALAEHLGLTPCVVDLSTAHQAVKNSVDAALGVAGTYWASGQLAATVRTPAYYYVTSVLSEQGFPALVLGTTNRDEGSYLGYVGKASDAVVDLQLIADLHKSEVYAAARELGVTEEILSVDPAGDMYDGRCDVEVFGASYDALELYLSMRETPKERCEALQKDWNEGSRQQYARIVKNLDALHAYNAHKYSSGWPGVFLNVLHSSTPGGWTLAPLDPVIEKPAQVEALRGLIRLDTDFLAPSFSLKTTRRLRPVFKNCATQLKAERLDALLSPAEAQQLLNQLTPHTWFPVGTSGYESEYTPGDPIGSYRLRAYDERLAERLWERLRPYLDCCLVTPEGAIPDAGHALLWRPVGVSALFRFIRYERAGTLVAHYDSPYQVNPEVQTLKSLIIYLTSQNTEEGQTRFISDAQDLLKPSARNYSDWPRPATEAEVLASVSPRCGDALIFDHRLLHDSAPLQYEDTKIIIRTDILYQALGPTCVK